MELANKLYMCVFDYDFSLGKMDGLNLKVKSYENKLKILTLTKCDLVAFNDMFVW